MGLKGVCRVSTLLVAFVACGYQCLLSAFQQYNDCLFTFLGYGFLGLIFSILSIVCIDMIHMNPADSFTWKSMLDHYAWFTLHIVYGWWNYRYIAEISKNVTKQQDEALMGIINKNKTTDYCKDYGIDKVTNSAEYRKNIPFASYEMMRGYVDRLREGDQKAFTNDGIRCVIYTTGTTGGKKYYPLVNSAPIEKLKGIKEYTVYRRAGRSMGRTLMLMHTYNQIVSKPGIPLTTTMSSAAFSHSEFWIIPREVFFICEETSYLYASAVFALRERELDGMKTIFSSMMFSFWVTINGNWRQICDVIERGYIERGTLKVDDETLSKINSYLTPDPERAEELRLEFSEGSFRIARRIWPRIQYVDMICTGSLAHPANLLKEHQLYGVPFLSLYVSASEVMSGFNTDKQLDKYEYTLYPLMQYFEWVPESEVSEANPETLQTEQLEVGKSYELVATTYAGLMRYRTGDVLKCVNKYNQLPVFSFCYRYGQLLSLVGEKISEKLFYDSLLATCQELKVNLTDYTCTGNRSMIKIQSYINKYEDPLIALPRYLLFCEFAQSGMKLSLSADDEKKFDENIRKRNEMYDQLRMDNNLAATKVFLMKPGSFQALKNLMIKDTQNQQFKMPRVINNEVFLEFILTQVESD